VSVCHDSRTAAMSDLGSSAFVQSRRPGPPTPDLRAHRKTRRVCVLLPGGAALPLHEEGGAELWRPQEREIMMREMLPLFRTIVKGKEQGVDGKANIMKIFYGNEGSLKILMAYKEVL